MTNARASFRRGVHPRQRRRLEYPPHLNLIPNFPQWLQTLVQLGNEDIDVDVVDLSMPPRQRIRTFKSLKAYRNKLRMASAEVHLVTANSGVIVTCETLQRSGLSDRNLIAGEVTYYGKIVDIIELDYGRLNPSFYCAIGCLPY